MLPMITNSSYASPTDESKSKRDSATTTKQNRVTLGTGSREQFDIPNLVKTKADIYQALERILARRNQAKA
jgi:hypothetical protein